jgi:hypothetical protein
MVSMGPVKIWRRRTTKQTACRSCTQTGGVFGQTLYSLRYDIHPFSVAFNPLKFDFALGFGEKRKVAALSDVGTRTLTIII